MMKFIGRAQVHNWGSKVFIIAQLFKSQGVKPEDYNLGSELEHREHISLYNILDTDDPNFLMLSYVGKPSSRYTVGREVNEYVMEPGYWVTEEELMRKESND